MEVVSQDHMDLDEALSRLQPRRRPRRDDLASENNETSNRWDLNTNFDQARELAEVGWEEKAGELDNYMNTISQLVEGGWSTHWDVAGECVDVGAFLEGEPECMLNFNLPKVKTVKMVVNLSARCSADAPRLLNRGIAVASAVYALQASGVAVSLQGAEWVSGEGRNGVRGLHETMIELNRFGQYIDPARLAFWLGHPATLRRCIFRFNEQQSPAIREQFGFETHGGYGRPEDIDQQTLNERGYVYLPFPETDDLDRYETPKRAFEEVQRILAGQGINLSRAE